MAMADEDLIEILRREEQEATNEQDKTAGDRQKARDYYDRNPTGDEQEGQSKVVTSEFSDTVESFMPSLMRVFCSGEDIVEFSPLSKADEEWAKQATQYVPHVVMRENDGFRIHYWAFKDGLTMRQCAVTVDAEETEERREDAVESWTGEQLAAAEEAAKQAGASELSIDVKPDPAPEMPMGEEMPMDMPAPPETFSGTITLVRRKQRVVIDNIAPEDILITPGARDIDTASYAGFRKQVSASDLRKMGLSQDDIDELSAERPVSSEEDQRQDGALSTMYTRKDSERRFWLVVAYVKADENGDGISEMLRCVYAHAGGQSGRIIERMEWDGEAAIAVGSPILMPHTLGGRSLFDQVQDLQDVGTALTRGMLDNLYLTNRPRPAINSRVNINQVLDWTPGMPIQVGGNENPNASIAWLQVPSVIPAAQSALEYFATVRENRTGVTRYNQGLDADSLNKTAAGVNMIMTAAQQRQELVARVFAETFIKRLMRLVYRTIKRTATGPVKYFNGEDWADCDPTKWPDDMHLVVNVALGTGNKQQEMQNLMLIGAAQEKLAAAQGGPTGPLVNMEHYANTARKLVEAAGFKSSSMFVASPKEVKEAPEQPQKPDPEMAKVQAKSQADQASLQANIALKRMEMEANIQLQREQAQADMQIAREKAALDLQISREKAALDAQLKSQELAAETALGKYEIDNAPKPAPGATNIREQQVSQ